MGSRTTTKPVDTIPLVLNTEELQLISRALADPTRFDIFQNIAAGRCLSCSELRENFEVTAPTISHHLEELENAGLVESTRAGKFVNLTLRRDVWQAYLKELAKI